MASDPFLSWCVNSVSFVIRILFIDFLILFIYIVFFLFFLFFVYNGYLSFFCCCLSWKWKYTDKKVTKTLRFLLLLLFWNTRTLGKGRIRKSNKKSSIKKIFRTRLESLPVFVFLSRLLTGNSGETILYCLRKGI